MNSTRITVTVAPQDYAVLQRLSALQGGSMSSIVRELIGAVTPALSRTADLMERASGAQREVLAGIAAAASASEDAVMGPLAEAEKAFAALMDQADEALAGPPSSNTGGRTPNPLPSTPSSPTSPEADDDAI